MQELSRHDSHAVELDGIIIELIAERQNIFEALLKFAYDFV